MQELISVIMPVYNASQWLDKSIGCLMDQTYPYWELLAVDDDSKDDSLAILNIWKQKDPRIKVFHKANGGPAKARAFGIKNAQGHYTFYFDSDDTIKNDILEACLSSLIKNNADIALPDLIQHSPEGKILNDNYKTWDIIPGSTIDGQEAFERSIEWHGTWAHGLYRTDLFKKIACDEKYLSHYNSSELITRIQFLHCNKVAYCDSEYYYNIHSESVSRKISAKYFEYLDTDIQLIQEAATHGQPRNVVAKTEVFAFREMIELWHLYSDNLSHFNKKEKKNVNEKFALFLKRFPKENICEMLSVRPGLTPKLQRLLLLHGWPLCRVSLTLARIAKKKNKLYPWFSEEQIKSLK